MKKAIILILALVTVCTAAFALEPVEPALDYSAKIDFAFQPTLARYNAMAQTGLAAPGRLDSFYTNPAALGEKRFGLAVPSASITLYNIQKTLVDRDTMESIDDLSKAKTKNERTSALVDVLQGLIGHLGNGYNNLATIDTSLALSLGWFGVGANLQVKLHTLAEGNSNLASVQIIPEVNLAPTVAFGMNIIDTEALTVAAGVSGHFVSKVYFKAVNANTVIEAINDKNVEETFMWKTPVMSGFAIPFDFGATVGFANNTLRVSATLNNINGKYYMKSFTALGFIDDSTEKVPKDNLGNPKYTAKKSVDFEIKTPMELNFGFAWTPDFGFVKPVLTADLVDMLDLVRGFGDNFRASDLLLHLNAGAECNVLDILSLRLGVNRGYVSFGAGLGYTGFRIETAYGWQEFGESLGDKPVDSFTVKVTIGVDD